MIELFHGQIFLVHDGGAGGDEIVADESDQWKQSIGEILNRLNRWVGIKPFGLSKRDIVKMLSPIDLGKSKRWRREDI